MLLKRNQTLNGINNISFGRRNNDLNTVDNKNNRKGNVKASVAVGITAAAIGGIALYKNRNSKPVLKFRNFIKDGVILPLKEKNVPLKKKLSNAWDNLKAGIKNVKSKPKNYSDTVEFEAPKRYGIKKSIEKSSTVKNNIINSDIGKKSDVKSLVNSKKSSSKTKLAIEDKLAAVKNKVFKSKVSKQVKKPASVDKESSKHQSIADKAKKHARDLRVAAGTAAVVTGGVVAGDKIGEKIHENKDKTFSIKYKGEEFKGRLENSTAYEANGKPLTGRLTISYNSGKKAIIAYKDGILKQSVLFGESDKIIPETIRKYT